MHYQYDVSYVMEESLVALLSGIFSSIPSFAFSIATYVLSSLALYTLAKRRGINHPWLSWVPVANVWILGSLSDQYRYVVKGEIKSKRKVLVALNIVIAALTAAMAIVALVLVGHVIHSAMYSADPREILESVLGPLLGIVGISIPLAGVGIALAIFRYMALYDLYTSCDPQNNVLFLVLSILFGFTEPFFLFFSRNKDLGMPPRRQEPQYIPYEYNEPPQWQEQENKDYL